MNTADFWIVGILAWIGETIAYTMSLWIKIV